MPHLFLLYTSYIIIIHYFPLRWCDVQSSSQCFHFTLTFVTPVYYSKFVLPHLKLILFDCHCSWAVVLSFDFENGENRFVGLMQPHSQAFVFLATFSMQIQRRRTHHLHGRKKRREHKRQCLPINSNLALHWHCLATALAPSPWTDIQKCWRFFPGHPMCFLLFTWHYITDSICKWKQSNTDGGRCLGMN